MLVSVGGSLRGNFGVLRVFAVSLARRIRSVRNCVRHPRQGRLPGDEAAQHQDHDFDERYEQSEDVPRGFA